MDNDPFGLGGGGASVSDTEIEAVSPFAATVLDNAVNIILMQFGKQCEIGRVTANTVTGAEIETSLVGDYFLVDAEVQSQRGEVLPCQTFLDRDPTALAFDLDRPSTPTDWSEQVERLQNPIELLAEAVNAHLGGQGQGDLSLGQPGVRVVSLPDDFASLLLGPDQQYLELTYQLDVADVGEIQVTSVVATELIRRLAGTETGMTMDAEPAPQPAGAGARRTAASDPLMGFGADPFSMPTGRTGADILESIPPLTESSLGGLGMGGGYGGGFPSAPSRGPEVGAVRPAQFPSFGESPSREPVSNIDLILDVHLRITVELGRTTKSIREVLDLGPGAVIELDKLAGEPVDILVNDKPIAKGEVVVVDENFGVRVTDIISPQNRVATLR